MRFRIFIAFFGCLLFVSSGCGGGASYEVSGSISGRVSLKDGSVPGEGLVNLYAPVTGVSAQANLDSEGNFSLKQIPVGEYQVSVTPPPQLPPGAPSAGSNQSTSKIPPKYYNASTSGLLVTVKPGENSLNLHLE